MRIIRAANLVPQPWHNGLGTTRPIHTEADWQIGVADLEGEAAFSAFEGRDRTFTLIEGQGALLEVEGLAPLPCRPGVPVLFPGDKPTHYRPTAGPARAFNVHVVRGAARARVQVASLAGAYRTPRETAVVFCVEGRVAIGTEMLGAGDTALHLGSSAMEAAGAAVVIVVVFEPADEDGSPTTSPPLAPFDVI